MVIDYTDRAAWEYQAWAFQARGVTQGQETVSCILRNLDSGQCVDKDISRGAIDLDGFEYDACPSKLQFTFRSAGSTTWNGNPGSPAYINDSALTLGVMDLDLRQDGSGPPSTKARFDI